MDEDFETEDVGTEKIGFFRALYRLFFGKPEEIDYAPHLLRGVNATPMTVYQAVEQRLLERKVPGLKPGRKSFLEGGLLSDKREYLTLKRERLMFYICAAPFGVDFFISCRLVVLPLKFTLLDWFVIGLLLFGFGYGVHTNVLWTMLPLFFRRGLGSMIPFYWLRTGIPQAGIFLAITLLVFILTGVLGRALADVDGFLIQVPVLGKIYQVFFRRDTWYRDDLTVMFNSAVGAVVQDVVAEVTEPKRIRPLGDDSAELMAAGSAH